MADDNDTKLGISEEIMKLLNTQVIENTLSLQAVDEVKKIVAENQRLQTQLTTSERHLKESNAEISQLKNNATLSNSEISRLQKRNEELEAQEKVYFEQGVKFAYENKRGEEMKEILGWALRNPVITKSRIENGSIPIPVEGHAGSAGFVMTHPASSTVTESHTTE